MVCPHCKDESVGSRVADSRESGGEIRRRRVCFKCKKKFTTYESSRSKTSRAELEKHLTTIRFEAKKMLAFANQILEETK